MMPKRSSKTLPKDPNELAAFIVEKAVGEKPPKLANPSNGKSIPHKR